MKNGYIFIILDEIHIIKVLKRKENTFFSFLLHVVSFHILYKDMRLYINGELLINFNYSEILDEKKFLYISFFSLLFEDYS